MGTTAILKAAQETKLNLDIARTDGANLDGKRPRDEHTVVGVELFIDSDFFTSYVSTRVNDVFDDGGGYACDVCFRFGQLWALPFLVETVFNALTLIVMLMTEELQMSIRTHAIATEYRQIQ